MSYVCLPAIVIEPDLRHKPGDFGSIEAAAAAITLAANSLLYGPDNPPPDVPTHYELGRPVRGYAPKVLCYAQAAVNSALQMVRDLNRQRIAAGKLALTPLAYGLGGVDGHFNKPAPGWRENSESYYLFGHMGTYVTLDYATSLGAQFYPGYIYLSALQLVQDDVSAQDPTKTFEPVRSPEGILPYPPARLAQVQLTDTYNLLRQTEENALELLAQSKAPAQVAEISTSLTVTDPIGRLVTGEIVQSVVGGGTPNLQPSFPGTLVGAPRLASGDVAPGQGAGGIVQAAAEANGERQPVLPGGTGTSGTPVLPEAHTDIAASITTGASLLRVALILGTVLFGNKK